MKIIKEFVDAIKDELESAEEYAEKFVEMKAKNDVPAANKYKEMANDELKHADYEHTWALKAIDEISKVYVPPVEMQEAWDKAHKEYVQHAAWIKQMLAM